jgi:UDP-N-acetylglucosamine 2-epimerase
MFTFAGNNGLKKEVGVSCKVYAQVVNNGYISQLNEKGYTPKADKKYILVTGHRRENFGDGFLNICKALKEIG